VEAIKYPRWIKFFAHMDTRKSLTQGWLRVEDGTSMRGP
jgi:hypothetical protein